MNKGLDLNIRPDIEIEDHKSSNKRRLRRKILRKETSKDSKRKKAQEKN